MTGRNRTDEDFLRAALEYYACAGLGDCDTMRLRSGACARAVTGDACGHMARIALDGGDPQAAWSVARNGPGNSTWHGVALKPHTPKPD